MSLKFEVAVVAAMSSNRAIGRKNQMPWSIPDEMRHFIGVTSGRICIAGANTAKSIGKGLKGRPCFVVADPQRTADIGAFVEDGWIVCPTFEKALEDAAVMAHRGGSKPMVNGSTVPVICVIGGAEMYRQALPRADYVVLTHIEMDVPDADTFFPEFDLSAYEVQEVRGKKLPVVNVETGQEVEPAWQPMFYAKPGTEVHTCWNSDHETTTETQDPQS